MARMHGGAHGKSGSKKPYGKEGHAWLTLKPKEVEMLVVKLAKEGNSPSRIGLVLRDSYGIPDVRSVLKKRVTEVLAAKKLLHELPDDLLGLIRKDLSLHKHAQTNKQDMSAKRGILLTESKINRLLKYYKRTGRIPESWKYDPDKAGMYVG